MPLSSTKKPVPIIIGRRGGSPSGLAGANRDANATMHGLMARYVSESAELDGMSAILVVPLLRTIAPTDATLPSYHAASIAASVAHFGASAQCAELLRSESQASRYRVRRGGTMGQAEEWRILAEEATQEKIHENEWM